MTAIFISLWRLTRESLETADASISDRSACTLLVVRILVVSDDCCCSAAGEARAGDSKCVGTIAVQQFLGIELSRVTDPVDLGSQ